MSRSNLEPHDHAPHDEDHAALHAHHDPESRRLHEDARREKNWKRWGPYLSERQWGTVREDYSPDGSCWDYFPHDQARSRAYRWGEDGLLGITDRECRLCFALALWNGRDPILKERLFGLTGPEGNHGEDVKETYFYLDSTPTHSYMKALYKYPQAEYPYHRLVEENRRRGRDQRELEIEDTGVFEGGRYFDVVAEYAKAGPDDVLIRITVSNRGPDAATLHVLPTLWCRNTWTWGCTHDGCWMKPRISALDDATFAANHVSLGCFRLAIAPLTSGERPELLFTENESNNERIYDSPSASPYVKDAFHRYVIEGKRDAVNPKSVGTKAAAHFRLNVPAGGSVTLKLRLFSEDSAPATPFDDGFDRIFSKRIEEADAFYAARQPSAIHLTDDERRVSRQGYASLLWSKQFYHYVVKDWLDGDPEQPPPPESRKHGRNHEWKHLFNRDVISMPDKWEYPWYAAWDLAFHMIPFATIDPEFAKEQILLFLREWYVHPNGQLPAYEFALGDVNPPVHAWAAWRVYKMSAPPGKRDRLFLERVFQKLLLNFTWWVNRKDAEGKNIFGGGFLGLDNIGVFDRSRPLPTGGYLEQADGTAWMAFYCTTMLAIALELAREDPAYEDMASKFFEHFVAIADAINCVGGTGLWDVGDGFYYDQLHVDGQKCPLRVRSMVGLIPLYAAEILEDDVLKKLPGFTKRMRWFLENRKDLAKHIAYMEEGKHTHRLLAIPSRERLERVLRFMLDENEFLSPYGIRSVSRVHKDQPYTFWHGGEAFTVDYSPGESRTGLFGGNSNWRGPIWMPVNFLLIEALERYHHFYGDSLKVECPVGSGRLLNLKEVARELARRLSSLFLPDASGRRPCTGDDRRFVDDPHYGGLVPFHEYFHGDTGRGLGASHQTGWTSLVVRCIEDLAKSRAFSEAYKMTRREGGIAVADLAADARGGFAPEAPVNSRSEWLEADGLGGYVSGTVSGIRTRRYHALLLTAATPPTGRFVLVNGFDAWVETPGGRFAISSQRYAPDVVHPDGESRIFSFEPEPWPRWVFRLADGTEIEQEIFVANGASVAALTWRVRGNRSGVTLTVRPFFSGRDYHSMHHENSSFRFQPDVREGGRMIWHPYDGIPKILSVSSGEYLHDPQWYRNFLYSEERARGLDDVEDLASPGTLRFGLSRGEAAWILGAEGHDASAMPPGVPAGQVLAALRALEEKRRARFATPLDRAADAYVVLRGQGRTLVAGYPWFTDWGRDTFIAMRGLCLATGRLDVATEILVEWASAVSEGMLPNRFPDRGEKPEFNSVDASLWFIIAADELLAAAETQNGIVAPSHRRAIEDAIQAILEGYSRGTRFGIRKDADDLLAAGERGYQLTWMDARVGDTCITPREGKPVEIQALWLNALAIGARRDGRWKAPLERGATAFVQRFWNEAGGYLHDVVDVEHRAGTVDSRFRPNQLFAVGGLPLALIDVDRARRVVDAVEAKLWTPLGPRTLAPGEPGYCGHCEGEPSQRDGAYHQGTVWPWLAGPFVEAWVRVRGNTPAVQREARARFFEPLRAHLDDAGLGHLSEIADGDPPHTPRGCPFQAWSLGEFLRLDRVVLASGSPPLPRRGDSGRRSATPPKEATPRGRRTS